MATLRGKNPARASSKAGLHPWHEATCSRAEGSPAPVAPASPDSSWRQTAPGGGWEGPGAETTPQGARPGCEGSWSEPEPRGPLWWGWGPVWASRKQINRVREGSSLPTKKHLPAPRRALWWSAHPPGPGAAARPARSQARQLGYQPQLLLTAGQGRPGPCSPDTRPWNSSGGIFTN